MNYGPTIPASLSHSFGSIGTVPYTNMGNRTRPSNVLVYLLTKTTTLLAADLSFLRPPSYLAHGRAWCPQGIQYPDNKRIYLRPRSGSSPGFLMLLSEAFVFGCAAIYPFSDSSSIGIGTYASPPSDHRANPSILKDLVDTNSVVMGAESLSLDTDGHPFHQPLGPSVTRCARRGATTMPCPCPLIPNHLAENVR